MRHWDIELTNDEAQIEKGFEEEPQLCMVLAKDIKHNTLHRLSEDAYIFIDRIDNEDRVVIVAGAFKAHRDVEPDPLKTEKAFGRQVTEQIHDDLVHIDGIPYFPYCSDLDPKVISRQAKVFDVQAINLEGRTRHAIRGCYYDVANPPEIEGGIISQGEPIIIRSD